MVHIGYYCRNCKKETLHQIEGFTEENPALNFAKLKCIKCTQEPFVVEYPKGASAPTHISRRVNEVIGNDQINDAPCLGCFLL